MKVKNILKPFAFLLMFPSCLYKAGNRQSDLDYRIPININTFYVEKYIRQHWVKDIYETPVNSELVNYPHDFAPLTDSLNKLTYVVELRVSEDSLKNTGWGLSLSSIFDLKKRKWITVRDSLKNNEFEKFKIFFRDSVLMEVVNEYKNKMPDSLLFLEHLDTIIYKPAD